MLLFVFQDKDINLISFFFYTIFCPIIPSKVLLMYGSQSLFCYKLSSLKIELTPLRRWCDQFTSTFVLRFKISFNFKWIGYEKIQQMIKKKKKQNRLYKARKSSFLRCTSMWNVLPVCVRSAVSTKRSHYPLPSQGHVRWSPCSVSAAAFCTSKYPHGSYSSAIVNPL